MIEGFNHGYVANLPLRQGSITLEIGAGIGGHLRYENLALQEYHCLEYREEFCTELRKLMPERQVHLGSIEKKQPWSDRTFDRLIAIHVLEHLPNLPAALAEAKRLMKDDGVFDIVIPCEGGFAYSMARKISAERLFRRTFHMDYTPIIRNEHVNAFSEMAWLVKEHFVVETTSYYPFRIPSANLNLCVGMRLRKK